MPQRDANSDTEDMAQLPSGMVKTFQATLSQIAASRDLQEILNTITANARRLVGAEVAQVNLHNPETGQAWVGARDDGRAARPSDPPTPPRPDGTTMQVVRQGKPIVVEDVLRHPLFADYEPARQWGLRTWAGFPIKRQDVVIGVLMVAFVEPHHLDTQAQTALELLASQAAVALENARLFAAEQERRQMADALAEVSRILGATLDLSDILNLTLDQLAKVIRYDSCSIILAENDSLRIVAGRGFPDNEKIVGRQVELRSGSMASRAMAEKEPFVIPDIRQETHWRPNTEYARSIMSWIGVPLMAKGQVLGLLTVDSLTPNSYGAADAHTVAAFANQAAIAIQNAQLFEAEQERRRIAEALSQTASILTSTLNIEQVLALVLESLRIVIDYDSSSIFLRQGKQLVMAANQGFSESVQVENFAFAIQDSALRPILIEEGQPMIIPDVRQAADFRHAAGHDTIRSWIGAPLWARGRLVGLLTVDHAQPGMYSERDAQKVMAFANQAAIVIENARLHAAVQVHAEELEWRVQERTAELQREKEKTETILNSVADGVVVAGLDGRVLLANPVAERWLMFEVNGRSVPNYPLRQFIARLVQNSQVERVHLTEFPLGPSQVTLEARAARLFEDERALGIVVVLRDVTRQQELERLKSQFIASVSHELRTPLANVKLYLSLLQRGKEEKRARYLAVATQEANRLEELIQDLLDFSNLQDPLNKAVHQPLRLAEIAQQTTASWRTRAADRGITITERISPHAPTVRGDAIQLARVLTHLLENAINYTLNGGHITLEVRSLAVRNGFCVDVAGFDAAETQGLHLPDVPDGDWAGVVIRDTGIGILPQDLPHIFERFFRGSQARTMSLPGTGLGLSQAKSIVTQHSGYITASSAVDQGSLFVILLPAHSVESQEASDAERHSHRE
ncbi:MAG: GAF domain-containing protein [Chloroflexota bacterium]